jgi:nucleotide-binding universal stress UspA family protein
LGAHCTLAHVFDATPFRFGFTKSREELGKQLTDAANHELRELASQHFEEVDITDTVAIDAESTPAAIADYADEHGTGLCVVGTHGRTGLSRLLIGSVAENIVRHAHCDVLTVPPKTAHAVLPKRILATTDFSPASAHALEIAGMLRRTLGAELTLVHTFDPTLPVPNTGETPGPFLPIEELRQQLDASMQEAKTTHFGDDPKVSTDLVVGESTAEAILAYAEDKAVDLIVIGSHGRTGLARFLIGSVAERVIRGAPCPVLTVRSHLAPAKEASAEG